MFSVPLLLVLFFFFFLSFGVEARGHYLIVCFFNFIAHNFNDIPGSGANGAIIHYKPEPDSCSVVDERKLFLLDSGAQYVDGTTDITRTVHFGEPASRQKDCFTRVLQVSFKFL